MPDTYTTHRGEILSLDFLDTEELILVSEIIDYAATNPNDWEFSNLWHAKVAALYDSRGMSRMKSRATVVYRIAQDLDSRLMVDQGHAVFPY